jgi:DNA invertase Pin-like site-specific DNA recombinase
MTRIFAYIREREQDSGIKMRKLQIEIYCSYFFPNVPIKFVEEKILRPKALPQLKQLKTELKSGDIFIISEFLELNLSTQELLKFIHYLNKNNIFFHSLKEQIDTSGFYRSSIVEIFEMFDQFMKDIKKENQNIRKENQKKTGGKKKIDIRKLNRAFKLYEARTKTISEICKIVKISESSFYRHLKKRK